MAATIAVRQSGAVILTRRDVRSACCPTYRTVVVFGAGPVGIIAARCAWLMGAGRVIVVDHVDYRLEFVQRYAQCEVVNFKEVDDMAVHIKGMTDWLGADVCIDAVGCEAEGSFLQRLTGVRMKLQSGAATVLHWAINSARKGAMYRSSASTARPSTLCRSAMRSTRG